MVSPTGFSMRVEEASWFGFCCLVEQVWIAELLGDELLNAGCHYQDPTLIGPFVALFLPDS